MEGTWVRRGLCLYERLYWVADSTLIRSLELEVLKTPRVERRTSKSGANMKQIKTTLCMIALTVATQANTLRITAVSNTPYPPVVSANSRTTTVYSAEMMLDGNPATFACLLDDSPTGANPDTKPKNGSAPVTGTLTVDLGGEFEVDGIELLSRKDGGYYLPREIELLGMKADIPAVPAGTSHVIRFAPRKLKTIELKIRSSYETGPIHFNYQIAELRVSIKDSAGTRKMLTGTGEIPSTLPEEDSFVVAEREFTQSRRNKTEPYPIARLLKDWIYQDYGTTYQQCFSDSQSNDIEHKLAAKVILELRLAGVKTTAQEAMMEAGHSWHRRLRS